MSAWCAFTDCANLDMSNSRSTLNQRRLLSTFLWCHVLTQLDCCMLCCLEHQSSSWTSCKECSMWQCAFQWHKEVWSVVVRQHSFIFMMNYTGLTSQSESLTSWCTDVWTDTLCNISSTAARLSPMLLVGNVCGQPVVFSLLYHDTGSTYVHHWAVRLSLWLARQFGIHCLTTSELCRTLTVVGVIFKLCASLSNNELSALEIFYVH